MRVLYVCTYYRRDHIEQLLDFRKEYRKRLKLGRAQADQFARNEAIRRVALTSRELVVGVLFLGKKLFFG